MPARGAQQGRASTASTPIRQNAARSKDRSASSVVVAPTAVPAQAKGFYWDARIVAHKTPTGYQYVGPTEPAPKSAVSDNVFKLPHVDQIFDKFELSAQTCQWKERNEGLANGEYRYQLTEAASRTWVDSDTLCTAVFAAQLAAFLTTEHGIESTAASDLVAQQCNINELFGSLMSISIPSDFPVIDDFKPEVGGDKAECVVKPTTAPPRFQSIYIGSVTSTVAQEMLVKQLCGMLRGQQATLQELWRWILRDDKGNIVAQAGRFHAVFNLGQSTENITEDEAFRVMNELPGWLDLGYDVIELQYMYRFDHCDVCKLNATFRHTSDDCPKKSRSEHAHKRRRCIATDEDVMLSVQQEHDVKDNLGSTPV